MKQEACLGHAVIKVGEHLVHILGRFAEPIGAGAEKVLRIDANNAALADLANCHLFEESLNVEKELLLHLDIERMDPNA